MTRQMADDEVLRRKKARENMRQVVEQSVAKSGSGALLLSACTVADLFAAVAALQAERDAALREISCCDDVNLGVPLAQSISELQQHRERAEAERDALRKEVERAGEALVEVNQQWREKCERAEYALEALRGQVAGLLAADEELVEAEIVWENAPCSVTCDSPEYQRLTRATDARIAALLAIKERMG